MFLLEANKVDPLTHFFKVFKNTTKKTKNIMSQWGLVFRGGGGANYIFTKKMLQSVIIPVLYTELY